MMMIAKIANGTYFMHPEGSAWIAAHFAGGKCVDMAYESDVETHRSANDSWGGVVPSEADSDVEAETAEEIIRECMSEDTNCEMVVVQKSCPLRRP
jgi:hypothetical protein